MPQLKTQPDNPEAAQNPEFKLSDEVREEILKGAQRQLRDALGESTEDRADAMGCYLESLANLDAAKEGLPEIPQNLPRDLIEEAVTMLRPEVLKEAADQINGIIADVLRNPQNSEALLVSSCEIEWPLLARQRFTSRIRGARVLQQQGLTGEFEIPEEILEAIEEFDQVIRPRAWALAFSNTRRKGHAMMIHPENQQEYWWWTEGLDLDWRAVTQAVNETGKLPERREDLGDFIEQCRLALQEKLKGKEEEGQE